MLKVHGIYLLAALILGLTTVQADSFRHGDIRPQNPGLACDEDVREWLTVDQFWVNYAEARGGITWRRLSQYSEYSKVREHDTFMVQSAAGLCLMEFFHKRWRRANDVRRWDPLFNEYAGCPRVFE